MMQQKTQPPKPTSSQSLLAKQETQIKGERGNQKKPNQLPNGL